MKKIIYILILAIFTYIIADSICMKSNDSHIYQTFINLHSKTNYLIHVDLDVCKMYVFRKDKIYKIYSVSGGKDSTRSPLGSWTIINKHRWGEGFGGYWMGFNVPWGKYGIHGTTQPGTVGYNASHGCIRMFNKDVKELYSYIPHNTRVTITQGPYGPFGLYYRALKPGNRGSDVFAIQKELKKRGYFKNYVSGIYTNYMKSAIHKFQKDKKLHIRDTIYISEYVNLGLFPMD